MVFQVNVTSITDTVMLVIAGGLPLLLRAGIRMYPHRTRISRHRAAQGADGAGEGIGSDRASSGRPAPRAAGPRRAAAGPAVRRRNGDERAAPGPVRAPLPRPARREPPATAGLRVPGLHRRTGRARPGTAGPA